MSSNRYFHQVRTSWVLFCQVLWSTIRHNSKMISFHVKSLSKSLYYGAPLILLIFGGTAMYHWLVHSLGRHSFRSYTLAKCVPSNESPVLLNLNTKMRVYYDGGQWFHMAENYLAQHSILSNSNRLLDGKAVWYNFDKGHFTNNMNPFTRLIVYLGTAAVSNNIRSISFLDYPSLSSIEMSYHVREGDGIFISNNLLETAQTFRLGPAVDTTIRFSKIKRRKRDRRALHSSQDVSASIVSSFLPTFNSPKVQAVKEEGVCFKYLGKAGGEIVRRDEWFSSGEDIVSLRAKMRSACPPNKDLLRRYGKSRPYKMVVYQRDMTRRLENQDYVIDSLQKKLSASWQILIVRHDDDRSPCVLSHMLSDADVLLTPHGFQSTLLMFLPSPSLIFEIFPYPYYKPPYKLLAKSLGIVHSSYTSPPTSSVFSFLKYFGYDLTSCNAFYLCRDFSRRQNVILDEAGVNSLVSAIKNYKPLFTQNPAYQNCSFPGDHILKYIPSQREYVYSPLP